MKSEKVHQPYCFAGQPAPCPGYFEADVLPCVCGATQDILIALQEVQVPAIPVSNKRRAEVRPADATEYKRECA